ncbi:MAG: carboxypeptidase-like regulatory domain-containing protein [Bacteroidota bacterium]|nr:carboxypeptidase-like regulatory domain-containing protein [Bacteroidota bacterium]MDP4251326.1 carboxypeptidase-like regulatory domain-containing protein [Bacteroidota bacterium]
MNEKGKQIKSYTASDIRQYLDGKLSAAEMYALEKAAMDDPFLADAIEGMAMNDQRGHVPFETGLDDLKRRLQEKINQREKRKKILPLFFRWQVAAAIGLLLISGAISYTFLIKKPATDKEISQNRKKESTQDSIIHKISPAASEPARETSPVTKNILPERPDLKENDLATTDKSGTKKRRTQYETIKKHLPANQEIASAEKIDEDRSINVPAPEMKRSDSATSMNSALQGKVAGVNIQSRGRNRDLSNQNYLQGFVTDSSGNPISSATVSLKNKKMAVTTDQHGFFKLKTNIPDSNQDVVVSSAGYLPATASLMPSGKPDKTIRLRETDNSLSEVVVTAYGLKKEKRILSYQRSSGAEPGTGWAEYNQYLIKNKKITTADSSLKGTETISFVVHKNGTLSHFRIEHSISPAHDAELIRLVKAGPAWRVLSGIKQRCSVSLNF